MKLLTKKLAREIAGSLSDTTKMACLSYGLPAIDSCPIGAILAQKEGTICHDCYACKGFYKVYPSVLQAQWKRFKGTKDSLWTRAMVTLIDNAPYFRWHDSGDIYSMEYLEKIMDVARKTPDTKHWLPTREAKMIAQYLQGNALPSNMTVRISGSVYDRLPGLTRFRGNMAVLTQTSTVHKDKKPIGFACPSRAQGNQCGECRACWDKSVDNVSYEAH